MKERGIKNRCRVFEIPKNVKYITALPRMKKYIEYSAKVYSIYLKYISKLDIYVYSIDEAFLDVTNYLSLYKKTPIELAKTILADIYEQTKLTATAGIGTNLFLTKIALDITAKHSPTHIGYLNEDKFKKELCDHLPLTDFWQIGKGIEKRLNKLNIYTLKDIVDTDELILYKEFGVNARYLIDHAKGIEPVTINDIKKYIPKSNSISNSQILFKDYNYINARTVLIEMVDFITIELVKRKLYTKNISIMIGYSKDIISSLNISKKLYNSTNSYSTILNEILNLYDNNINKNIPIRKLGISLNGLTDKLVKQLDIFNINIDEVKDSNIQSTILNIKNKYGKNAILRGISYEEYATGRTRNKLIGGHNAE